MPKELADSKKELTEKHEMLEKTTMLGTRLGVLVHLGLMSSGSPRINKLPFGLELWRIRFIHLPKEQLMDVRGACFFVFQILDYPQQNDRNATAWTACRTNG